MIKRWEIRENTVTENSVYLLLVEGTDDSAEKITNELSAFCHLIDVVIPPFSYVFELYNITDDSILEKIRIRIEEISQYVGVEGDINERTKHIDLDVISPETQIFGQYNNDETVKEPTVFMDEPENKEEPENDLPAPQEPAKQQTVLPKTEPYIVKSAKASAVQNRSAVQNQPAAQKQVPVSKKANTVIKPFVPPAIKPKIPALKPQMLKAKPSFASIKPVWGRPVKKQSGTPAPAVKPPAVKETQQNKPALPVQKNTAQNPVIQKPEIRKNAPLQTIFKKPFVSRPVVQKPQLQKPQLQKPSNLNSGHIASPKKAGSADFHLNKIGLNKTSLGPVPVNNIPDKKELFEPTQIQEHKVEPSDIFVQSKSSDSKVQLSTGEFSVKMDSGIGNSFDVAPGNDMEVGDGTFINLSGAEGTMLKKIDTTEYNISTEDSSSEEVGIATLIGGKYKDDSVDDINEEAQSLKLMGNLANGIQNRQPSYEQHNARTGKVELDKNSTSFNIRNDETIHRDIIRESPVQAPKVEISSLGSSLSNAAADVRSAAQVSRQSAPVPAVKADNADSEKAGSIMEFINKIVALITAKINSFISGKQQQAPLAYNKEITPQDDFNEMLQKEQAKNLEAQPDNSALQPAGQVSASAGQAASASAGQTVNPEGNGVKVAVQKSQDKNPFANLGNIPKEKPAIVSAKGSDSLKKAAADINRNKSVTVNGRLPETDSNLSDLSAKIQVDDIFEAETIYESFADKNYDYADSAMQGFKEGGSSANARAEALSSRQQNMPEDLEVPNIFSGAPKKENKTVVTPSPKPQGNINNSRQVPVAAQVRQSKSQAVVSGTVNGNKTVINKAPAVRKISAVNTGLPKAAVKKPVNTIFKSNLPKMTAQSANKTMISASAQKTMFKPLKPSVKPAMPSVSNKILNKKVSPKQESETNKVSLKDAVMQGAVDYGKDKLKDAISDKIDNANPVAMFKAGFMSKKAASPKQEIKPDKVSLKDAAMQGVVDYGKDKLKDAIEDKIDNADPVAMFKAGFMSKKAASPK